MLADYFRRHLKCSKNLIVTQKLTARIKALFIPLQSIQMNTCVGSISRLRFPIADLPIQSR